MGFSSWTRLSKLQVKEDPIGAYLRRTFRKEKKLECWRQGRTWLPETISNRRQGMFYQPKTLYHPKLTETCSARGDKMPPQGSKKNSNLRILTERPLKPTSAHPNTQLNIIKGSKPYPTRTSSNSKNLCSRLTTSSSIYTFYRCRSRS